MGGLFRALGSLAGGVVMLAIFGISVAAFILMVFFTETFVGLLLTLMPFLQWVVGFGFLISVVLGLPLLLFQLTRPVSAMIFTVTAWALGMATWMFSVVVVYSLWGKFATIIGIVLMPAIVPMAALATLFGGDWSELGSLVLAIVLWFALIGGTALASHLSDRYALRSAPARAG